LRPLEGRLPRYVSASDLSGSRSMLPTNRKVKSPASAKRSL
jgi:hypothetical protein